MTRGLYYKPTNKVKLVDQIIATGFRHNKAGLMRLPVKVLYGVRREALNYWEAKQTHGLEVFN